MPEDGFSIDVLGLPALHAKLADMSTKALERATRKALREGAAIVQQAVTERAQEKDTTGGVLPDGALKSDIVVRLKQGKDDGIIRAYIGPDKDTAYVARWVEYGHRMIRGGRSRLYKLTGKVKGPGRHVGDIPAHPFIRPGWEASRSQAADVIQKTLVSEIEKAWKKKGTL
jgi:HK97 gp10 family phage protein